MQSIGQNNEELNIDNKRLSNLCEKQSARIKELDEQSQQEI